MSETLRERLEALAEEYMNVHGNPSEDNADLGLYAEAYRECAGDLAVLLAETQQ